MCLYFFYLQTTIVKSRNSSPLNMDYSNNLECGSNNITYTNYKVIKLK